MDLKAGELFDLYDLPKDELLRSKKAKVSTKLKSFFRRGIFKN
jgi:hypothetical protein